MKIRDLRYVLAKAAIHTPGVYYYSSDIAEEAPDSIRKVLKNVCGLVGLEALKTLEPGGQADIAFGKIYKNEKDNGTWKAVVMRGEDSVFDEYPRPDLFDEDNTDTLRSLISENINQCPKTMIVDEAMFSDFGEKESIDGDQLSPLSQGVMMACNAWAPYLDIGETARLVFTLVTVGAKEGSVFLLELTRTDDED